MSPLNFSASRRGVIATGLGFAAVATLPFAWGTQAATISSQLTQGTTTMTSSFVTTTDGVEIFFRIGVRRTPSPSCSITAGR